MHNAMVLKNMSLKKTEKMEAHVQLIPVFIVRNSVGLQSSTFYTTLALMAIQHIHTFCKHFPGIMQLNR
jgi:glutamine amidotransferase PdxT